MRQRQKFRFHHVVNEVQEGVEEAGGVEEPDGLVEVGGLAAGGVLGYWAACYRLAFDESERALVRGLLRR